MFTRMFTSSGLQMTDVELDARIMALEELNSQNGAKFIILQFFQTVCDLE